MHETDGSSSSDVAGGTVLGVSKRKANYRTSMPPIGATIIQPTAVSMEEQVMLSSQQSKQITCPVVPITCATLFTGSSSLPSNPIDDLHRLVNYQHHHQQQYYHEHQQASQFSHTLPLPLPQTQSQQPLPPALNPLPNFLPTAFSDRLWEWNPFPEANRDYSNNPFK